MKLRIFNLIAVVMAFVATATAQSLSIAPIEAAPGAQTEITVSLKDATEMTALQCNLHLPEGLTLAESTGNYGITLGDAANGHTLSVSPLTSGDLLIVLYSMNQTPFADGTLLTIPVVVAEEAGTTEGSLHTVRTATADAVSKALSDAKFSAVVEEEPLKGITSIDELNNETLYHVALPHHSKGLASWAVAEGGTAIKSNVDLGLTPDAADAKQQFAFISNDGGATRYLYHAAEKKFIGKKGVLTEAPMDVVFFREGAYDNTFFAYFDNNNYINVGGSHQMTVDSWSTADGGNSCLIVPVGDFDPTEALKAFPVEVTGITLNHSSANLIKGDTLTLTATVSPDDATDKTVTWSTSDATIATVENGLVTAVAAGSATITAKAGGKEATCVVTVSLPDGIDFPIINSKLSTIYDLAGRRVRSTDNLKAGIYIVNGRKVVNRP